MMKITLKKPDDFHVHLRDGQKLNTTVPHCATQFARALVMPNLSSPVTNISLAQQYRERILNVIPAEQKFTPLMSLYLTDNTSPQEIIAAKKSEIIYGCKLYPAGATTNSDSGVTNIKNIYPVLEAMQEVDLPLLVHGEVTDSNIDIFDREQVFLDTILQETIKQFPELRIVVEHITTKYAVDFVLEQNQNIAATITAHHLFINRNDMLAGGIKPHYYCLPVAKRQSHQQALIKAATSGSSKFFAGTDSAPHTQSSKESSCGCAGIYTSHAAIELYAQIFEQENCLEKLEKFASINGASFYKLPVNEEMITLEKKSWQVPNNYPLGDDVVIPFFANHELQWKLTQ